MFSKRENQCQRCILSTLILKLISRHCTYTSELIAVTCYCFILVKDIDYSVNVWGHLRIWQYISDKMYVFWNSLQRIELLAIGLNTDCNVRFLYFDRVHWKEYISNLGTFYHFLIQERSWRSKGTRILEFSSTYTTLKFIWGSFHFYIFILAPWNPFKIPLSDTFKALTVKI